MPHTYSGKARINRPDARPNAKRRKKERAAAMEKADVSELRGTRIPNSKRKERSAGGELKKEQFPPEAKRAKFLTKLLKQIESLMEKKEKGVKLDKAQLEKIGRYDDVVAEIEELLDVDLGSSDEEEEEKEEEKSEEENDSDEERKNNDVEDDEIVHQRESKKKRSRKE
uniref:Uncharacterized protein n=1 Tax=Ditylum brightwellii TaxID=49249 RepID=A0A7S1VYW8_9STRA|mmetsp:Transcript_1059/g.1726  ORF Transcript_1059/g.1726 Transcript_1059/m.1726 type:complete len:169 (+) Transcript_1059:135-641(+)